MAYGVKTCGGTKASTAAESGGITSQGVFSAGGPDAAIHQLREDTGFGVARMGDALLRLMRSQNLIVDASKEVVLEEKVEPDLLMPRADRSRRRLREKTAMSTIIVRK